MVRSIERALAEVAKLPEGEQESIGAWLLEELAAERCWSQAFDSSPDVLSRMATDALREFREGRTQPLDPDGM